MAKIEINEITSGYNLPAINAAFQAIESEFKDKVMYRDEVAPMLQDLDMNGFSLINVLNLNGVDVSDLQATLDQVAANIDDINTVANNIDDVVIVADNIGVVQTAYDNAINAAASASDAAASALAADASADLATNQQQLAEDAADAAVAAAVLAQSYSTLGLPTGGAIDFGFVTDPINSFPTDWGSV